MDQKRLFGGLDEGMRSCGGSTEPEANARCVGRAIAEGGMQPKDEAATKDAQKEASSATAKIMVSNGSKGAPLDVANGNRRMGQEGRQCEGSIRAEAKATKREIRELIHRQCYRCAACGAGLTPDDSELDHKIPRVDGGDDSIRNLQWLCKSCNRAKGTLPMPSFVGMCKRIAEFWTGI